MKNNNTNKILRFETCENCGFEHLFITSDSVTKQVGIKQLKIYIVTAVEDINFCESQRQHLGKEKNIAFFAKLTVANHSIINNSIKINDNLYKYVVVTELSEGINPYKSTCVYYKFDIALKTYVLMD